MVKVSASLFTFLFSLLTASAQGWPENYGGVMLQGFYWDGYADSKWNVLEKQADELAQYFDIIWIPNSGKTSDYYHSKRNTMGYDPCFWLDHNTCWGTEAELKSMIKTFSEKGTGIIEDVVINHKNGLTSWVDFPDETIGSYSIKWDNTNYSGICKNDECNKNGYKTTGANDTGDNFEGYRDLDHTNATVQQNVKTYLDFLLKELGYVGFRYDMVKGFCAKYVGEYNTSSAPTFSVGECWDYNKTVVTNWIDNTKIDGFIQSAAFDFPMKYNINSAFGNGLWNALAKDMLANDPNYARYAVTFVDNHDTFRRDEGKKDYLGNNICAANAYVLTMPGTPCLFLKHWQSNKATLKRLIALRKAAGITNQSKLLTAEALGGGFMICVQGSIGKLRLHVGPVGEIDFNNPVDMWQMAIEGKNFQLFASKDVDLTAMQAITGEDDQPEDGSPITIPDFCTVSEGEICAFFEAPDNWETPIKCWRWDNNYNYTTNQWPGVTCEKVGDSSRGNSVWKWTYDETDRKNQKSSNEGIIFSDVQQVNGRGNQTADLPFTNGGYYFKQEGLVGVVTPTAINSIVKSKPVDCQSYYDFLGRRINGYPTKKGVYIHNGKKTVIK